ncbi:hypothetical protein ASE38_17175 [Cellulomonas sp. Root930]|nr:hypothetical protein ASE38_17175 [Cellulomonas sp. Root930]
MTATARVPSAPPVRSAGPVPRQDARVGVRELLSTERGFAALDDGTRRDLAGALARIGSAALDNADVEGQRSSPAVSRGLSAGSEFSGVATDRLARTTRDTLDAVSFPRFVTELITGVFKAMNDSNQQQLTAFVDLIRNVAQTTEGFADSNVGVSGARQWLAERFPSSYVIEGAEEDADADDLTGLDPDERRERQAEIQAERDASTRLVLRPGSRPPSEAALRTALGVPEGDSIAAGDPEALLPLVRQTLARNRQQLLATMVQMGLQRIVIESGRLNASMRFHIDTSSAAENDKGSQFDLRNTVEGGVGAKFGPWGVEAKVQNTIGYVTTDRTSTSEEMNTSVDLDSGVELVFRTDYVPLDRLATGADADRIRVNTLNPNAEVETSARRRDAQTAARSAERKARAERLDSALRPPAQPATAPRSGSPGVPGGVGAPVAGSGTGNSGGVQTGTGTGGGSPGTGGSGGTGTGTSGGPQRTPGSGDGSPRTGASPATGGTGTTGSGPAEPGGDRGGTGAGASVATGGTRT